ncbi:CMP/dCMP-type deaminase domain-containing protein [Tumidithrix helvetica PCC 7403]|uniref:deaminase domain-containing protein n=1 Tax=Tumidithrix helvetica TaxID=3457545 RepID=UPI003CBFC682
MQASAALIRERYLDGKPIGKGNVAVAEIYLTQNIAFCAGATSRGGRQSPIQIPIPKSQGGQFEPSVDSRTDRLMDTDAEYKVLSEIANILDKDYNDQAKGNLYLYTEYQPCESCNSILQQFQEKFLFVNIEIFWDLPYPHDH